MASRAEIKQNLHLVVGGSWCWARLAERKQTQPLMGLSLQLQEIKHTLVCALDQVVAGQGLVDRLGHPYALYQTGPKLLTTD